MILIKNKPFSLRFHWVREAWRKIWGVRDPLEEGSGRQTGDNVMKL